MTPPRFTPDTIILDAIEADERVPGVFAHLGLKCMECVAVNETLRDAARYHDVNLDRILNELNRLTP